MTSEDVRNDYVFRTMDSMGGVWSTDHTAYTIQKMADEIVRLREALAAVEAERDALQQQLASVQEEYKYDDAIIDGQAKLLIGVANALKGKPNPLSMHSHHDLPEVAQEMADEIVRLRSILAKLREPSEAVLNVAAQFDMDFVEGLRAIVAAAEREVDA